MAANRRKTWHAQLDKIEKEVTSSFPDNPGKVAQLVGALATAHMVVDDLYDYPAYVLPTNI